MNKSRIIPLVIVSMIASFAISSCGPSYSEEKAQIDSMITVLNKNIERLNVYSVEKINAKNDTFKQLYAAIDSVYNFSKPDSNFAMINNFINIQKPFRRHDKKLKKVLDDINFQIHQLTTLKEDMDSKSMRKEEIKKYFTIETNECEKVIETVNIYFNMIKSQVEIYDSLSPKISQLIPLYQSKKPAAKRTK